MSLPPLYPLSELRWQDIRNPTIAVNLWSSVANPVYVYGYTRHGPFYKDLTPTSDRLMTSVTFRVPELPLTVHMGILSGVTVRGQTYARCSLEVAGATVARLIQGYVANNRGLTWPPTFDEPSFGGRGHIRYVTGTNPAAGAEISETVPTNAIWRLLTVLTTLVTSADTANRRPALKITDGTTQIWFLAANSVEAASTTTRHNYALGWPTVESAITADQQYPLPPLTLKGSYKIETVTSSLQAKDDWAAPSMLVEEWLEHNP